MAPTLAVTRAAQQLAANATLSINTQLREMAAGIVQSHMALADSMRPFVRQIANYENIFARLRDAILIWERRVQELAPEKRYLLAYLAQRGWHLNLEMEWWDPDLADLVAQDDPVSVDAYVADRVEETLAAMQAEAEKRCPERAPLIADAVGAFREEKYALLIPLVLTQTDGISSDVLGVTAFGKQDGRPKTATVIALRKRKNVARAALAEWSGLDLFPLEEGSSLLVNTSERDAARANDPNCGPLNRHGVLHGIDTDFGTRENALRAFAVLGYFLWLPALLEDNGGAGG